jgi:hypothetical protein
VVNQTTGKACLLEFKRQAATIETTRLNQIADNLTIARAQVSDLLYRKHKRMKIEPEAVSWAIIDCSDQELPPRFRDRGSSARLVLMRSAALKMSPKPTVWRAS